MKSRTVRPSLFVVFALSLWALLDTPFALASPSGKAKYKTENVIILVMDGPRDTETIGDPQHKNVPHLWNDFRSIGTVFLNVYNTGITVTKPGHSTISTGTWQYCQNEGPRMTMPSIFDYYRDELAVPRSKTWVLFGKGSYAYLPVSSFGAYTDRFAPNHEAGYGEDPEADFRVRDRLFSIMHESHPSLVFVNFGHVDSAGHHDVWEPYLKGIQNCDRVFWDIWQKIQSDTKASISRKREHRRQSER